jgi:hypothetical protein
MDKKTLFIFLFSINVLSAQNNTAKFIKLSDIKLCELTLSDLKKTDKNLKEVDVVEMDLCSDGFVQDSRFVNKKGYASPLYPGVIFQKDTYEDYISKLRLTKEFKGYLPNQTFIDLEKLNAKDIPEKYLKLENWSSRGCSDYWSINNDSIYFFVAINKNKEPRYPLDEPYYLSKPVEAIDIVYNCSNYYQEKQATTEPLYIIDDKIVSKTALEKYDPNDIDNVTVLKDKGATDKYGDKGKNGVIIIITKTYLENEKKKK